MEENMISLPRKPHRRAISSSARLEQSAPQPSSLSSFRRAGVGAALTAKYSLNPGFQEKAAFTRRAFSRRPFSS